MGGGDLKKWLAAHGSRSTVCRRSPDELEPFIGTGFRLKTGMTKNLEE